LASHHPQAVVPHAWTPYIGEAPDHDNIFRILILLRTKHPS
jgi:hypothetical protein